MTREEARLILCGNDPEREMVMDMFDCILKRGEALMELNKLAERFLNHECMGALANDVYRITTKALERR